MRRSWLAWFAVLGVSCDACFAQDSLLDQRWELDPASKQGVLRITPYNPVFVLPYFHSSDPNEQPSSPGAGNSVPEPVDLNSTEFKFQLSLKVKLLENLIGENGDVWMGYTQSSRWQLYSGNISRPFRETNYEPELMFVWRTRYSLLGWQGRLAALSLMHQSNGRAQPLSRSWNRIVATIGFERPGWAITLRPWYRLKEDVADDDNPDVEDFAGRADLQLVGRWHRQELSLLLRHSLRGGDRAHGAAEMNWSFPIFGRLKGFMQVFKGYGESLIDYNHNATYFGLGLSLVEWSGSFQ